MEFDYSFLMKIEDVFLIRSRGVVVTGRVESGPIKVGDEVEITGGSEVLHSRVVGIEIFHKSLQVAETGDNVGILLHGVTKDQLERGMQIRSTR